MIILEGADGAGKTTAAEELSRILQAPLIHSPGYNVNWWMSAFAHHEADPGDIVIYDRFYFSEFVYGPVLRGSNRVEPWFEEYVRKVWLPSVKPLVIFCHVPYETAEVTSTARDQMAGVSEHLAEIQQAYESFFKHEAFTSIKGPWLMHHDFTKKPLDIEAVRSWVRQRKVLANVGHHI